MFSTPTDAGPATVQPPTNLVADVIAGNTVRLRWTNPTGGLAPTGFLLEGGIHPGTVLASIPTGSVQPSFTIVAPTGVFHVRMHTLAGASRSAASNEIRIVVNTPAVAPSAPTGLLGLVNGSSLALAWRNTYAGGPPASVVLDVSGSITASLPLGPVDTFRFSGVPPGTYTLAVRATNPAGSSAASNPVTLTFPAGCTGVPQAPANLLVTKAGNVLEATWHPPVAGAAPTGYVLHVSGSFSGAFPLPSRAISGAVGPGSYTLSVSAVNACGNGPATAPMTVAVP
jgi:hypothetical protein